MKTKIATSLKPELNLVEERIQSSELQALSSRVEKLQTSHNDLAAKLSELKGGIKVVGLLFAVISLIFAVLSGLAGYNIYKYQKFEAVRSQELEFFVDLFQKALGETIDRVSFVNPVDKQSYRVKELIDIQERIKNQGVSSDRLSARSDLADATILVIEQKNQEASIKLDMIRKRTVHSDPFVYARALTLQAVMLVRPTRDCTNPEVKKLVTDAVKQDNELASAYNILGLCLTDEAVQMAKSPSEENWLSAARTMQDGLKYYDLSFALKPTAWALSKSLNNKVWGNLVFFESALGNDLRVKQILAMTNYGDFDHFVTDSLAQLKLSKTLSPNQAVWWETEAELQGLRNAYYQDTDKSIAEAALVAMKKEYRDAIGNGLFADKRDANEALEYFKSDTLLRKIHHDPEILELIKKSAGAGIPR